MTSNGGCFGSLSNIAALKLLIDESVVSSPAAGVVDNMLEGISNFLRGFIGSVG